MTNPALIDLAADTWVKVAANVTSGYIHIKNTKPRYYLHTYRTAGDAAPSGVDEGVLITPTEGIVISASSNIDVYIMAVGFDGRVRADL